MTYLTCGFAFPALDFTRTFELDNGANRCFLRGSRGDRDGLGEGTEGGECLAAEAKGGYILEVGE